MVSSSLCNLEGQRLRPKGQIILYSINEDKPMTLLNTSGPDRQILYYYAFTKSPLQTENRQHCVFVISQPALACVCVCPLIVTQREAV